MKPTRKWCSVCGIEIPPESRGKELPVKVLGAWHHLECWQKKNPTSEVHFWDEAKAEMTAPAKPPPPPPAPVVRRAASPASYQRPLLLGLPKKGAA